MQKIEKRKITDLKPRQLNKEIYNDTCDKNLLADIKKNGILTPLLITHDDRIISGHKRFEAAQVKKLKELEVIVYDKKDELDIKEAIITSNKQRHKTNEQKGKEYVAQLEIEKQRAAQRQKNTQPQKGQQVGSSQVTKNSAEPNESGEAREIAAKKVGLSHDTAKKISEINEAIDGCRKRGETELADNLLNTLNKKSPNSAYKQADDEGLIIKGVPAEMKGELKKKSEFNKTTKPIDWAIWSWNPITGCKHECRYTYCYGVDMANRLYQNYPKGFEPHFREERLDAPKNTKFRSEYNDNIRLRSVFVCSIADLFGEWVDEDAISFGAGFKYFFSGRTMLFGGYRQVDSDNDYRDEGVFGVGLRHSF